MTDQFVKFVKTLEAILGTVHTKTSFSEEWAQNTPQKASGKLLKDYLSKVNDSFYTKQSMFDRFKILVGILARQVRWLSRSQRFPQALSQEVPKEPYASPW